jgi:hypothetical protein
LRIGQSEQKKKKGKRRETNLLGQYESKKAYKLRVAISFCLFHAWQLPGLLSVVDFSGAFFVNHDLFDDHGALNILLKKTIK